jgi:hypothetical protein
MPYLDCAALVIGGEQIKMVHNYVTFSVTITNTQNAL